MSSVNDQITDAMSQINAMLLGSSASQSMAMLDVTSTESLGMSMLNAVSAQQNSQTSASASTTASCARMIQAQTPSSGQKDLDNALNKVKEAEQNVASTLLVAALYSEYMKNNSDKKNPAIENDLQKLVNEAKTKLLDVDPKVVDGGVTIANTQITDVVKALSPTPTPTPTPTP